MNYWLKCCLALTLLSSHGVSAASFEQQSVAVQIDDKALRVRSPLLRKPASLRVYVKDAEQPLFGEMQETKDHLTFIPSAPFIRGQVYRVEIQDKKGFWTKMEVSFDQKGATPPQVSASPAVHEIPANTLKLYLDFDRPMEQGDFLRQVTLQKKDGSAVAGAFRETELWSPDGKRLTLMFHPGRQKTGVNLNVDEGPVLVAGERYTLLISGQWRSDEGVPLGKEAAFVIEPVAADHAQPDPQRWHVSPPKKQTRERLTILTDEIFEPAIFSRALKVQRHGESITGAAKAEIADLKRTAWTFLPEREWQAGIYEIHIDPLLEDLAGNNLVRPFEVDVSQAQPAPAMKQTKLRFEVR